MVTNLRRSTLLAVICCLIAPLPAPGTEESLREELRRVIEQVSTEGALPGRDIPVTSPEVIAAIYENTKFQPLWTDTDKIAALIVAVKSAPDHGLLANDYLGQEIEDDGQRISNEEKLSDRDRAVIDILLTESLARLELHLRSGKVAPSAVWQEMRKPRYRSALARAEDLVDLLGTGSLGARLAAVSPKRAEYRRLQAGLAVYRNIAFSGGWAPVPAGATLRPGESGERVRWVRQRLVLTGDLARSTGQVDEPLLLDSVLSEALRQFQARHGLTVDGIVGPATLAAMNVPVASRIRQIEINLERMRWFDHGDGPPLLQVNVASMSARLVRGDTIAWQAKVQVGTTDNPTPQFSDRMAYLVFNPTWTIPYSIATGETLPAIIADPSYLGRNGIAVVDGNGRSVDASDVQWSTLGAGNFPYTLVQRPGAGNPLGRVKFMFPNEYGVYLHDTPNQDLFAYARRTFSHGCIRLERSFELAELLLGADGWTRERIDALVAGGNTTTVFLPEPVPIHVVYRTAEVDDNGVVYFYPDVYGRDARLSAALGAPSRRSGAH